ncbi:carboxynorspermidine decarboxylase [Tunicatimonas pelagia]|uniref:carboxynorspermidine decarboxylase n=1 Tax=Tunicatimonas pelagia TaxID=931531 RepID=UPI0026661CBC|nr:carboxynorspermidine decarboxylase [Tunicatimonas pelagia]WKN44636.1 carboxynorspermidine decarboxylase [Tunicatimonas pelagia]
MSIDFTQVPSACFVLEETKLRHNLAIMQRVQQASGVKIILALKGFSMFSVFPLVRQYLHGTTASSLNEARLGFEEFGDEVHAYCPAYFSDEFDEMMKYCTHLTFNSLNQWHKFKGRVQKHAKKISCGLRINPEYAEIETELYNPCALGTRLGISTEQLGDALPEGIEGIHFHTLCESDSYALERTLRVIENRFAPLLHQAKWLNWGGGHSMTREGYNLSHLVELIQEFKAKYQVEIIMEPGSAVAWEAGYLTATVEDIFDSQGIKAAVLDISISAHLPDCIEMPYTPTVLGATDAVPGQPAYRLGGLSCLAGDFVGDYHFDQPLKIGDRIVFNDMMHYTMVKTTFFNGVRHPAIGIWREDNTFELVAQPDYQAFKDKLS